MSTATSQTFLKTVVASGLITEEKLSEVLGSEFEGDPNEAAQLLIEAGLLTPFQAGPLLKGKTKGLVLGQYKILDIIGKGGMGIVYLAEHMKLHRKAAIKVLPKEKTTDKLNLDRFYREARAAAALDHPNIVKAFDVNEHNGMHYFVMDYVQGVNLQSYLDQKGPVPWRIAMSYLAQACWGLEHAHSKGMVHRDIKPGNLLVDRGGTLKILDLGLARCFTNENDNLTENLGDNKEVTGSINFICPEQALGQTVDIRGDIYSLGASIYALISGRPPVDGTVAQKLLQHQTTTPVALNVLNPDVPYEVAAVITKMMAKKPAHRFATPIDVINAITAWIPATLVNPSGVTDMVARTSIQRMPAAPQAEVNTEPLRAAAEDTQPTTSDEKTSSNVRKKKKKSRPQGRKVSIGIVPIIGICVALGLFALCIWGVYALIINAPTKPEQANKVESSKPAGSSRPSNRYDSKTSSPLDQTDSNQNQSSSNQNSPGSGRPTSPYDGGRSRYRPPGKESSKEQSPPPPKLEEIKIGGKAPELDGFDTDDKRMMLSEFRGKVVLVSFWGFWSEPCRNMFARQSALVDQQQGKPFVLVGVNHEKETISQEMFHKHLSNNKINWRSFQNKLSANDTITKRWGVKNIPTMFLIDHKGIIQASWEGEPKDNELESRIQSLVNEAAR